MKWEQVWHQVKSTTAGLKFKRAEIGASVVPGKKHYNRVKVDGANVVRNWQSRSTIACRVVVSLASENALELAAILETPLLTFVGLGLSE